MKAIIEKERESGDPRRTPEHARECDRLAKAHIR
jgi:hypothetical protein